MPKRTAKQIRLDTFAELEANGSLPNPIRRQGKDTVKKKQLVPKKVREPKMCCLDKYGADLPRWFRPCIDCFRTENST